MTRRKNADEAESTLSGLAGETADALEHLGSSKAARKAEKAEAKAEKRDGKQARKAAKAGAGQVVDGDGAITPKKARNAVRVAKVVLPAVVPVVAPYAVRAAGAVRERYDRFQARRMGIPVDEIGEYTGRGAALYARLAGVANGCGELREVATDQAEAAAFADRTEQTLRQLTATIHAAERMPSTRRKAAHKAVGEELDRIEEQLLVHLQRG